jgi:aminotransferase
MISTMLALVNPGDEVIIFQPFYENYGPDAIISGAKPVFIPLQPPHWNFDPDQLKAAFNHKTKALILNTPNNPTGKVFTRDELSLIAQLCIEHDVYVFSDEIYEHIIYTNTPHISIASLPGMSERTVTISGLSKTFSVTGWRLGYCVATAEITNAIRKTHDFLTVGAPHPLQMAAAAALSLPESYYQQLQRDYLHRKNIFLPYLKNSGLTVYEPEGAYYVMTDISPLGWKDDTAFVKKMIETIGVSAVPGSSFYAPKEIGKTMVRFMFAKRDETLHAAGERLTRLKSLQPD